MRRCGCKTYKGKPSREGVFRALQDKVEPPKGKNDGKKRALFDDAPDDTISSGHLAS